jgi:tRNA1(Val) A37 N6-methylase TrmN6
MEFDLIVSNPPFYHKDVNKSKNSNINFARYNDHLPLDKFIKKVAQITIPKARLFFCYDAKQLQEIMLILNKYHFQTEAIRFVYPKDSKNANLVLIGARKNSKSLMQIKSPIIMFDHDKFNDKITQLYKKIDTHSIKAQIDSEYL